MPWKQDDFHLIVAYLSKCIDVIIKTFWAYYIVFWSFKAGLYSLNSKVDMHKENLFLKSKCLKKTENFFASTLAMNFQISICVRVCLIWKTDTFRSRSSRRILELVSVYLFDPFIKKSLFNLNIQSAKPKTNSSFSFYRYLVQYGWIPNGYSCSDDRFHLYHLLS